MWVGESRSQAWGEYNTDRNMNYCGGGGQLLFSDLAREWEETFQV